MDMIRLIVLALAVWRMSMMLSDVTESGPGDILHKIRARAGVCFDLNSNPYGKNWVADGILCHKCSSIWFGAIGSLLLWLLPDLTFYVSLVFALSAVTVLLER